MTSESTLPHENLDIHDLHPSTESYREEVIAGLALPAKRLPSKLFYDQRGSRLFEEICELDEYYLTRTELAIMQSHASEMTRTMGADVVLIEPGSGASVKTRILLDHLASAKAYVPVDISREHLTQTASSINFDYPKLQVYPVCADFTARFQLPQAIDADSRRIVYFPGSTIGNFEPRDAVGVLQNLRAICSNDGGLLIGVDRKKDVRTIEAAYNDAHGITAQFNKNILRRINDDLHTNFDEGKFEHRAHYNDHHGRIEMHLVSTQDQTVHLNGQQFSFDAAESICTEYSYKFSIDDIAALAEQSGFRLNDCWSDKAKMFSVLYLAAI